MQYGPQALPEVIPKSESGVTLDHYRMQSQKKNTKSLNMKARFRERHKPSQEYFQHCSNQVHFR